MHYPIKNTSTYSQRQENNLRKAKVNSSSISFNKIQKTEINIEIES